MLKVEMNKKHAYISTVFFVFSLFFVSPVLSPMINEHTIYLNWFVPFLDPYFYKYLKVMAHKMNGKGMAVALLLLGWMIIHGSMIEIVKGASIIVMVVYLQYAYKSIGFKGLYAAFNINIFIAVLQFILCFVDIGLAYAIGPQNIALALWGDYATEAFTNFYTIFFFPRTCGLSREAGFFAAAVSIMFVIYLFDKKRTISKVQIILFIVAYIVSFSKMSFFFPIILVIVLGRKLFDRIPFFAGFLCAWLALGGIVIYLNRVGFFSLRTITYVHRLYGYGIVLGYLTIKEILYGNSNGVSQLNDNAIEAFPLCELIIKEYNALCGYPEFIIHFGYIGLVVFLMFLYTLKLKTSGLWILLFATLDVDLLTATSFVVLVYWFVIYGIKYLDIKTWNEYRQMGSVAKHEKNRHI